MAVENIKRDADQFKRCQIEMATAIIETIAKELSTMKLKDDQLKECVNRIAFQVCSLIDGSASFEKNGETISPILTFKTDACAKDEVISCGGNSYMHEYVHRLAKAWFEARAKIGFDL